MALEQRHASSLTPELWAIICGFLLGEVRIGYVDNLALNQRQLEVHQLKLVCKQFRDMYAAYPGLVQQVYISDAFSGRSVSSLLAWLQQTKGSVQAFRSEDISSLDAMLTGLITSGQPINVLDISLPTCKSNCARSISLVSAFTRLEECALSHGGTQGVDLTPLGILPSLSHLRLLGRFKQLHQLRGLSRLECIHARISETPSFAPMLQHLDIVNTGSHTQGLSAYTSLTQLVWRNSLMWGINQQVYFNAPLSVIPINIGLLTQLHTLEVRTDSGAQGVTKLEWVTELTSLQELSLTSRCCGVVQHVTMLTKLTCLKVSGQTHQMPRLELPVANLDIEWDRLKDLQDLSICDVKLQLGQGFASLLQLDCLRQISFEGSLFSREKDGGYFAALIHVFYRLRPQVKLIYDLQVCNGWAQQLSL